MSLRFPIVRPRRRPRGSSSSLSRRLAVEALETRNLLAVDFTTAVGFGAPSLSAGAIAVDSSGNSFVAGFFSGSVNLNPGQGGTTLTATGNRDAYLAEYSKTGSLLWAKDIPSSDGGSTQVGGIALDASGNIFLTGSFSGTTSFDAGRSAALTSGSGGTDGFLAKYDSAGNYLWAESLSGEGVDQGNALAVDGRGNAVVVGSYTGATSLTTTTNVRTPISALTGEQSGAFVAKFGPNGSLLWADGFVGSRPEYGAHVALDASGNVYAGGIYQGTITIGATSLSVPGRASSAFVTKIDESGAVQWATGFGGTANTSSGGLVVDSTGSVYAAGTFKSPANFGGIALAPSGSYSDGYVTKLSPQGAGVWAEHFSGTNNLYVTGLGRDAVGNLYLGGGFLGSTDFNPNSAKDGKPAVLTSLGGSDIFVQKLDAAGNYQWSRQAGGTSSDSLTNLAVAGNDDVVSIGKFAGPAYFSGTALQSMGSTNVFLSRISTSAPTPPSGGGPITPPPSDGGGPITPPPSDGGGPITPPPGNGGGPITPPPGNGGGPITPPPPVNGGGPITYSSAIAVGATIIDARGVVLDSQGNSYVTGLFRGSANFNPAGTTPTTLTSTGLTDTYLAKYAPTGILVWAKSLGGTSDGSSQGNGIALDASGNILVTGNFSGTTSFDPNGSAPLTAGRGFIDAFLAKYSPSGTYLWAKSFDGDGPVLGNALALDSQGNAFVTGTYNGSSTFGGTTLTGTASAAYVTKLDGAGNVLWADGFGGNAPDSGTRIAVDTAGNAYAAGSYQGAITIGSNVLSNAGGSDLYIAKLAPNGGVVWADGFGGTGTDTLGNLVIDPTGKLDVVGSFVNTITFGNFTLNSNGGADAFVIQLDPTAMTPASQVRWAKQIGGAFGDYGSTVGADSQGNIYVGGQFSGVANFDPNGVVNFTSIGGLDGFVEKLDSTGKYQWALPFGGPNNDFVTGLAVYGPNDVTAIGRFAGPALLGTTLLQNVDNSNIFVAHVSAPQVAAPTVDFVSAVGFGGDSLDARSVAVDARGNSYVTGFFSGSVNFGTGSQVNVLTASAYHDIYVAEYSKTGALLWARDVAGSGFSRSQGNTVKVDSSGNVVIAGFFNDTINFNTGGDGNSNGSSLTSAGGSDAFVAKYDGSGNFLWSKSIGGPSADQGNAVSVDSAGNIYLTGSVTGEVNVGSLGVSSNGTNALITKIDPSGNVVWAKTFGSNGNTSGSRVVVDAAGNVYAQGTYTSNVAYTDAAGSSLTLNGNGRLPSVFTAKLNSDGSIAWADGFTGEGNVTAGGLAVDSAGSVFLDGTIRAATNFGGKTLTPNDGSKANGFVAKLNPNGSVAWAEQVGATTTNFAVDLATDSSGNVYVGGQFTGTTNFNIGTNGASRLLSSSSESQDLYVLKLDTNGSYVWARTAGGAGTDTFRALAVAAPDDVALVGLYNPPAYFRTITILPTTSSTNVFLARIAVQ